MHAWAFLPEDEEKTSDDKKFKPNLSAPKNKNKENNDNNNNNTGDENLRTPGGGGFSMSMFYGTLESSRADKAATAHDSPI
jgi:hypothetical protein